MVDAAFLRFFERAFQKRLELVEVPGMPAASWDRKAAYLLWRAEGNVAPAARDLDDEDRALLG